MNKKYRYFLIIIPSIILGATSFINPFIRGYRSGWVFIISLLFFTAAAITYYLYSRQNTPHEEDPSLHSEQEKIIPPSAPLDETPEQKNTTPRPEPAPAPSPIALGEMLKRVQTLLRDSIQDTELTDYDDPYKTTQFTITSTKTGAFANPNTVDNIIQYVLGAIPKGRKLWSALPQPELDNIIFSKKTPFPKKIPPNPSMVKIAANPAGAEKLYYSGWQLPIGQDAHNNKLGIAVKAIPHGMLVGESGSGKSVFNRTLLEFLRAAGWMIGIVDGKNTDYVKLGTVPNVVFVAATYPDWVRSISFVHGYMNERYSSMQKAAIGIEGQKETFPPFFFLIDEYASVRDTIIEKYGKKEWERTESQIADILQKGRQAAVHCLISTQHVNADLIPKSMQTNLGYKITLGKPSEQALRDFFEPNERSEARRIGASIDQATDKGRGIISVPNKDGVKKVTEFQSYFCYSPSSAVEDRDDPKVAEAWDSWKTQVTDVIPRLYPRMWWKEPDNSNMEEISQIMLDQIDEDTTVDQIDQTPLTAFDIPHEELADVDNPEYAWFQLADKTGVVPPTLEKYDYTSTKYLRLKNQKSLGNAWIEY